MKFCAYLLVLLAEKEGLTDSAQTKCSLMLFPSSAVFEFMILIDIQKYIRFILASSKCYSNIVVVLLSGQFQITWAAIVN